MVAVHRDQTWLAEWRNKAPRAEFSQPTDDTLEKAETAMLDPDRSAQDKKFAALAGVPQQVASEVTFSMWIPAKDLTSTFTDTEIMTSLGSGPQPAIWSANTLHLRDFKTIRNAGISFVCTNRDVCSKLGGQQLTICGKKYRIQPYSKYSNWYYVDLQRLPDETTDGEIYDWFVEHGTPPVYISPSRTVQGLRSRNRRVYFNQKTPPASLMIDATTPLRQIDFGDHGYAVVNHRIQAFNRVKPPFIQALQAERKARSAKQPAATSRSKKASPSPPKRAPTGDTTMNDAADSDYAPSESDHSDDSLKDASDGSAMEDVTTVSVQPSSVWQGADAPTFSITAAKRTDRTLTRILRAKQLAFGPVAPTAVADVHELPPSQSRYSAFASPNPFEWLSTGEDGTAPADQDLILWDGSNPPQSVASFIKLPKQSERVMNSAVVKYSAEEASLEQVSEIIEAYLKEYADVDGADEALYSLQAQPSVHRFLLDTSTPGNYQHLRSKTMNHAVLRMVARKLIPTNKEYSLNDEIVKLFPTATDLSSQTVLENLCGTTNDFWLQVHLAEFDLALQIIAPSIYMDPLKIGAVIQRSPSALPHPRWHLWDDDTLAALITSPLMDRLLQSPLPEELRSCIGALQQVATAAASPNVPSL